MKNRVIFFLFCGIWLAPWLRLAADEAKRPPNIVFILADDLGYADLGCYGSKFHETPNLDRLAAQGMRLTSGYACAPNCAPTRAALMSGQYMPRTGMYTVGSIERFPWRTRPLRPVENVEEMPAGKVLLPKALKEAGYVTGMVGKWHLGSSPGNGPTDRGFDEFFGFPGGASDYWKSPQLRRGKERVEEKEYLTDAFGREAVSFIRKHRERPFFLYLAFNAVHTPLQAPEPLKSRFEGKPASGGQGHAIYAAMMASMDANVGKVLAVLEELKLEEDTLVIFSSDNGGVGGYRREGIGGEEITDNAPLRGGKGMLYEGGIRVPYVFRWKGQIEAGTTSDQPVNSVDLYPTLLEAAAAPSPAGHALDGTSYLGVLRGGEAAGRPALFWHFPGYLGASGKTWRATPCGVIRDGEWKLIEFFEDGRKELYHLKDDPGEKKDAASSHPERVSELHRKLVEWRERLKAPMPQRNEAAERSRGGRGPERKAGGGAGGSPE